MIKYIFVTGGVVSGLGKGITAASLGRILKAKGLKVIAQKLDPYINVDPGMLSPFQHGEVYVTEDGAETDLDLGHYERFIDEDLNKYSNLTSGRVYRTVLDNERNGVYDGDTVQVIPHVTHEIKKFIYSVGKKINADVVITEIGGTVGDIESLPFIEAIRQVSNEVGRENCLFVHVTLAPCLSSGEIKTKPTQHSVKTLRSLGVSPNVIMLRTSKPIDDKIKKKLALYCNVEPDCVVENLDADILYEVPLQLLESGIDGIVSRELDLPRTKPELSDWREMVEKAKHRDGSVKIALVGKYVQMYDSYMSVAEALTHAGIYNGVKIDLKYVDTKDMTDDKSVAAQLDDADGVIVPGGFGDRGIEGMIGAAKYCRIHNKPYFGICLGMQISVIEYARNVLKYDDATSREFNPASAHKVIDIMEDQIGFENTGGTMRLGAYECVIKPGTLLSRCYGEGVKSVMERHRHRYEFNNAFRDAMQAAGLTLCGISPDGNLVEAVEVTKNLFHIGVQYHPEFKSRPVSPQPIFREFIAASKVYQANRDKKK